MVSSLGDRPPAIVHLQSPTCNRPPAATVGPRLQLLESSDEELEDVDWEQATDEVFQQGLMMEDPGIMQMQMPVDQVDARVSPGDAPSELDSDDEWDMEWDPTNKLPNTNYNHRTSWWKNWFVRSMWIAKSNALNANGLV